MYRRPSFLSLALVLALSTGLSGCGVTKLWGNEPVEAQETQRPGEKMREHAAALSETPWDVEKEGSFFGTMAGVLVNGARSAGQALDVFDWTESESPETRTAKRYLSKIRDQEGQDAVYTAVLKDLREKNADATAFRIEGIEALDYYRASLLTIEEIEDSGLRKDQAKAVLNASDEARRATIQASKALRLQASVFKAAAAVLKESDESLDTETISDEAGQLLLRADELRALGEELDID